MEGKKRKERRIVGINIVVFTRVSVVISRQKLILYGQKDNSEIKIKPVLKLHIISLSPPGMSPTHYQE